MFKQLIDPLDNLTLTCFVAMVPVVTLLVMLAVFRFPAWLATIFGSIITFCLALWVWKMPFDDGAHAYLYGAATGVWNRPRQSDCQWKSRKSAARDALTPHRSEGV